MWFKHSHVHHWHIWKHTSLLATNPAPEIKKQLYCILSSPDIKVRSKTAKPRCHFSQGHTCPTSNGTITNPPSFLKQHGLGILPSTVHQHFLMKIIISQLLILIHVAASSHCSVLLSDGHPFPASHTTTGNRQSILSKIFFRRQNSSFYRYNACCTFIIKTHELVQYSFRHTLNTKKIAFHHLVV